MATNGGVLADRDRQSEARQYVIHAAFKRAEELNRLRDFPDTPARSEEVPPKVAGLPSDRTDADPEETATTPETPVISIPIEIGDPTSVELPAITPQALPQSPQEDAQSVKKAEQAKPRPDARRRVYRTAGVNNRLTVPRSQTCQEPAYTQQSNPRMANSGIISGR